MFICPKCKNVLYRDGKTFKCQNKHSYDISKEGYVNLLLNNPHAGDNKDMVNARFMFLSKGYYKPLAIELKNVISKLTSASSTILDAGCGTGYYSSYIKEICNNMYAFDISPFATQKCAKHNPNINVCVASMIDIPLESNSIDLIYHIFSPLNEEENRRILKGNGYMIVVSPGENHLIELKKAIYSGAYLNDSLTNKYNLFNLIDEKRVNYKVNIPCEDIDNLLKMTPYFYKTKKEDLEKLSNLKELTVTCDFKISIYICKNM